MKDNAPQYPDISAILANKARGQRKRAALSFTEKLLLLEGLRNRIQPIIQAREARRRRQHQPTAQRTK
jgi:hypothetical protein